MTLISNGIIDSIAYSCCDVSHWHVCPYPIYEFMTYSEYVVPGCSRAYMTRIVPSFDWNSYDRDLSR
jgi:hypothetical protein